MLLHNNFWNTGYSISKHILKAQSLLIQAKFFSKIKCYISKNVNGVSLFTFRLPSPTILDCLFYYFFFFFVVDFRKIYFCR